MPIKRLSLCIFSVLSAFALTSCTAQAQPATQTQITTQTPLLRIGQTTTAPVIDGKLDDAAWKQGVVVGDFSITGSKTPASEGTQVRFVYDAQNLYVSWRCEEPLLIVAGQRMHEVHINAKNHDDKVISDDSVELFLQPGDKTKMREFDVNSIGTLFDAESDKSDLWKTRDDSWDSDAQSAGVQEDGYWTAEIAIPWKAFGLDTAPADGSSWALGLARNAVGRSEITAWNQTDSVAIHHMKDFGALVFGDHVPDIVPQALPAFEASKSTFMVQASEPVEVNVDLTSDKKTGHFKNTSTSSKTNIAVPISATAAKVLFKWDAKSGEKYFYRSPPLSLIAQSPQAHLTISTSSAWKLFVNGEKTNEGNATQNQDISISLADGINDIVVQAQSGQAKLQLQSPGASLDKSTAWRTHDVDAKVLSETDRRSWQIAPDKNSVVGTTGAPAYLQHTLLYNSTLSYPIEKPAFYIAQGTAQQITFLENGIHGIRFDDWQMSVAVPPQYEVLGSSGFYGNNIAKKPKFITSKIGNTTIDGKTMTLYHITATHPIIYQASPNITLTSFEVLFRLPKTAKLNTAEQSTFYYWADANKNAVSEAPHSIAVRALPPLDGTQPKKFVWELWSGNARSPQYDDADLVKDILDTSRQAGFNKSNLSYAL